MTKHHVLDVLESASRPMTANEIAAHLPHILPKTIEQTLLRLKRRGVLVVRTRRQNWQGKFSNVYELATPPEPVDLLEDDGWTPQPWRHPYARQEAA
jgi:predicted ArsR family transcriptional regulator